MTRLLIVLSVAILTACGTPVGTPNEAAVATRENCEVAFQQIETGESIARLESNLRALDSTIELCPTVEDWTEFAGQHFPEVDLSDVNAFLEARCENNPDLADSVLCTGM